MSLQIGAVSYLNTKPLIYGLRSRLPEARLVLDLPSRLSDRLRSGDLDVALIPSVEFLRQDGCSIVSDACIACRGPVRSVRLLFRKPPQLISTLALDEGSRTSAALAQVLLAERYGVRPELIPLPIDAKLDQCKADALVVIGDRAMQIETSRYVDVWDLGAQWQLQTGLPFVFAMWVSQSNSIPAELGIVLQQCRDQGLDNLDDIIRDEAPKYGLLPEDCRVYFTRQLHFRLGAQESRGLDLFRRQASELGLVPHSSKVLSLQPT